MKRVMMILTTALIAMGLCLSVSGCGDDKRQRRIRKPIPRVQPKRDFAKLSPEEQEKVVADRHELVRDMWRWPRNAGPSRDILEDGQACSTEADKTPAVRYANPLVMLTWLARCMQAKGWEIDPESETLRHIR